MTRNIREIEAEIASLEGDKSPITNEQLEIAAMGAIQEDCVSHHASDKYENLASFVRGSVGYVVPAFYIAILFFGLFCAAATYSIYRVKESAANYAILAFFCFISAWLCFDTSLFWSIRRVNLRCR